MATEYQNEQDQKYNEGLVTSFKIGFMAGLVCTSIVLWLAYVLWW